ncbi:hypothetical protein M9H77_02477 [Catharanthus roseus]|uniref:Uncharacterized protein n=1 Tax=Catharanthus roseus TaxID=4058 RepID=A0ACC0C8N9_CATRO|nr:hypothetical protein M9H77_02477 [Catharanthus roseus]
MLKSGPTIGGRFLSSMSVDALNLPPTELISSFKHIYYSSGYSGSHVSTVRVAEKANLKPISKEEKKNGMELNVVVSEFLLSRCHLMISDHFALLILLILNLAI